MNIATVTFTVNCFIMFYLTVWLPYVQKIDLEWAVYCPRMIPTATVCGLVCGFSLLKGMWPLYHMLTPVILALEFMGFINVLHFIPSCCDVKEGTAGGF